jgi:Amino acid synthesis
VIEPRKIIFHQETIFGEMDTRADKPNLRAAAAAVVSNPFAGRFVQDLSELFDLGASLGDRLVGQLTELLGAPVVSYGKAAIVGVNGEFEHGGALLHPKLGKPMRAAIGGGKAVIPSNVKVAPAGTPIDVPLGHKDESWSFDHFDTMIIALPDSPRPDELVMIIAMAAGGRVHPRCGSGPVT